MKKNNNVQSAYLPIFRAHALNIAGQIIMTVELRKAIRAAVYAVELSLYEVIKCNRQQAWKKFCNRFISALRAVARETKEAQKVISIVEKQLKGAEQK